MVTSPVLSEEKINVSFSHDSGVYAQDQLTVLLSVPTGCSIAFTTNGKMPTIMDNCGMSEVKVVLESKGTGYLLKNRERMVYPGVARSFLLDGLSLPSGSILRAAAVSSSGFLGEPETRVYYLNVDFTRRFPKCLVLSVVADPEDLLDYKKGILATGSFYDIWKQTLEAQEMISRGEVWNFQSNITQRGREWEKPCMIQIYDGSHTPAIEQNAGIRVTGNASRGENQKSFSFFFRKAYGSKYFDYELFPGIRKYRSFRLMAGGNNTEWLKFKDAFLHELVRDRSFTEALSRPAILFLNGEYWGPYLLCEKVTARMLCDHYEVCKDQVVLFKEGKRKSGIKEDVRLYEELMSYAREDLSDPVIWHEFCKIMDIRSMADYCAARVYIGDYDWGQDKNDILWRTRDRSFNEGRWQYVLYDVDYSSGLYSDERTAPETDHFHLAQERYPLFATALKNREFFLLFMTSLMQIGRGNCNLLRVLYLLVRYVHAWDPLMADCYKRFGDKRHLWNRSLRYTIRFFMRRYRHILPIVKEEARLQGH